MAAKVSEHLQHFLKAQSTEKPHQADLLERVLEHGTDLELQVNVAEDDGEAVADRENTWTDGIDQWFSFRIPRNADSDPEWHNYNLHWPLAAHVDCIGSTGWNWKKGESLWVGLDIDHFEDKVSVGVDGDTLTMIESLLSGLEYVELRKSTGGNGRHVYVFLDGVSSANHDEHKRVGEQVLQKICDDTGLNAKVVDKCGEILWIWARRATAKNDGFGLIKSSDRKLRKGELPAIVHHPTSKPYEEDEILEQTLEALLAYLKHCGLQPEPSYDRRYYAKIECDVCPAHGELHHEPPQNGGAILVHRNGDIGFHCHHGKHKNVTWSDIQKRLAVDFSMWRLRLARKGVSFDAIGGTRTSDPDRLIFDLESAKKAATQLGAEIDWGQLHEVDNLQVVFVKAGEHLEISIKLEGKHHRKTKPNVWERKRGEIKHTVLNLFPADEQGDPHADDYREIAIAHTRKREMAQV